MDLYKSDVAEDMRYWGDLEMPKAERLQVVSAEATKRWESEPDERRAEYEKRAAAEAKSTGQAHGKASPHEATPQGAENHDIPQAPLKLVPLGGRFPLDPNDVESHQDTHGFEKCVEKFVARRGWYTDPRQGFPNAVDEERVCRGGNCCKRILAATQTPGDLDWARPKQTAAELLHYIRLVLRHAQDKRRSVGPAHVHVLDPVVRLARRPCPKIVF